MSNIVGLPPSEPDEMKKLVGNLKRMLPDQMELNRLLAVLDKNKYDAYVTCGFSNTEALELLKAEKIKATIK